MRFSAEPPGKTSWIMWLSSTTDGIYKVCFPKFSFKFLYSNLFEQPADNDNSGIRSIFQARDGDLWVGTRGGVLYCMDMKTNKVKRKFDKTDIGNVYHIMQDRSGNFWFSTKGSGLVKGTPDAMSPQGLRLTRYVNRRGDPNSISSNRVYYTYQDSRGRIWVCTFYGGLNLIEQKGGKTIFRNKRNGLKSYPQYELYTDVRVITEDNNGRLWVGTTDGLMSFDGNFSKPSDIKFETYRGENNSGMTSNDISTIFKDSKGQIWMGIFGNGLNRIEYYDKKKHKPVLKSYSVNEKQSGNVITWITEDKNHSLWIGTENGVASLKEGSSFMKSYDRFAGLPDVVMEDNSSICLSDGRILIGCRQGLLAFNPATVMSENEMVFKTFIVDFKVMNKGLDETDPPIYQGSVKYAKKITLRHDQNTFALEYSAFDFSGRTGRFAYRMAGLDDGWQVTSDTRAVFINVPSGKYRFEVAIASADGRMPAASLSLPVTVRTVWYATAFAYVLYFLVFAGLCAWVFYYMRMRQQLRTEHEERVRALEAVEMKTEFLSNVSHEFKSPLSIILGFVGRMIASESDALRTRELDTVRQNAEKIHLLLDRMVRFNEDSSTSTLFIPSATSLGDFARTVYDRYAGAFGEKNISSRFEADEIGYIFMVDKVKMESALSNLLSNALKFTAPGGSVVMSVKTGEETEEMVYADISVSDTGCGIAPEDLPMIFRRYYRAPGSASADPGGSGIGLALVKETVDLHKGKLSVTSEPGKGSTFTIRLSTMKADSFVLRKDPGEHYSLHSLSNVWQHERKPIILIVEDNSDIRDFIAASLGKDYSFLTAEDGKRGLELLSTEKTDLVITDISMPGMDGLEMCREIRSSIKTAFLPIIVLTGKNDVKTETRSYEYADAFIAKPFDLDYLNNRIIQLLIRHENWLSKTREQKMLEPGAVEEGRSFDEELLQNVVDIVTRHLEDPSFSASVLCSESRYGSKQIYRRIKQLTGLGIVEFIRDIRLRKAALYLSQGKFTVSEVMYKVGFTTASYFSKCFKEKYGVSPSEYRGK